ncbi:MAG: insulinase family protein, partial [Caulobacteraceae bacterium]|nr:insulinase family protein [Caulobacteraceae bacterium]
KSERNVVEEELRQRVLADPYGRLFYLDIPEASYAVLPYHRPGIGSIADLDSATLEDVRAFHAVYYRPDNANLIVVGNFDPAKLDAWVDHYFGAIANPAASLPKVTAVEPPRAGAKTIYVYGPNVPLPAVVLSYAAPDAASPDAAALKVLDAVLTTGKSSRLYQLLVYRQQLATQVLSEPDLRRQAGAFIVGAVMSKGKTPDQGLAALKTELSRLREAPVTAAELASAKNQLIASVLQGREAVDGLGSELGQAIVVEGDAAKINSDVAAITAVTPADIQRVARRCLDDGAAVTLVYRAESQRPPGQPDALVQDSPAVAAVPLTPPASLPVAATLPADQRQTPPAPGPAVAVVPPHPFERTLANGLRVIVAKTSDLPIVSAQLSVRAGAATDPPPLAGLSSITAQMLPQGAGGRTAPQIAAAIESLGGSLDADAGYDSSAVHLSSLAATLPEAMPILADVARRPMLAEDELERVRRQQLDDLTVNLQQPEGIAGLIIPRVVFGEGPYGHPTGGFPQSLNRITRADVAGQYARLYRPDQAVLVLTGDITPEAGFALAERAFGDWAAPPSPPIAAPASAAAGPRQVVVVDLPGTGQASVTVAGRSIVRKDADYYAVKAANAILGVGYSARINEEIRVKRGLTYDARSEVSALRDGGLFSAAAQTRNDAAPEVADLLLQQLKGLGQTAPSSAELDARKATLTGGFGRAAATAEGLASLLSTDAVEGIPPQEVADYIPAIQAVGAEAARAAAAKLTDPAAADIVVVGDAKLFLPALRQRFGAVSVIPAGALDLDAADLGASTGAAAAGGAP